MRKKMSVISAWFLAVLAVLCVGAAGLGLHVISQPVKAAIPPSNCPELMREVFSQVKIDDDAIRGIFKGVRA